MWEQYTEETKKSELFSINPSFENYDLFVTLITETTIKSQNVPLIVSNRVNFTQKVWWTNCIDTLYNERLQAFRVFRRICGQKEYLKYKNLILNFAKLNQRAKKRSGRHIVQPLTKILPFRVCIIWQKYIVEVAKIIASF